MAGLYYFFYKNKNLISSIIAQEKGGEVQQTEKKIEKSVKHEISGELNVLPVGIEGMAGADNTSGSYEFIKAGDNYLAEWIDNLKLPDANNTAKENMQTVGIKGTAVTVDAIKFVTISEKVSSNKRFSDLPEEVFVELLRIYYPDPILRITASDGTEYIMPVSEEYIEASNWVSQFGIEMSGEYEALIICENIVKEENHNLNKYPELETFLERIDEFIKEKTGIDLRNGTRAIPIAVYKRIGERGEEKE